MDTPTNTQTIASGLNTLSGYLPEKLRNKTEFADFMGMVVTPLLVVATDGDLRLAPLVVSASLATIYATEITIDHFQRSLDDRRIAGWHNNRAD